MRKLLLLALAIPLSIQLHGCGNSTTALAQPTVASPINPTQFTSRVTELKEETSSRAVLAGVWVGEQEVARLAMGESMTGVPATPEMTVRIGGISQMFLGTLLMRLVEQGHLSLDDKISKWLPDLLAADRVTVGMLAQNTAGYKDYVRLEEFLEAVLDDPFRDFTSQELIEYAVADGELNFEPGTRQRYSHTEFTILQQVIERATGQTMPELYQREIFGPVGLSRTGYSQTPELPQPVLHAFIEDRGVYEDSTFWNPAWVGESGPLYSTMDDLARWAPVFGQGRLLQPASFQQLIERPDVAENPEVYFATCFVVANGWYLQTPNMNGFTGVMGYLPERDITLMVFATVEEGSEVDHPARVMFVELVNEFFPSNPVDL